ncbi:unnamed protein product, partial [Polarella glacialis]
ERFFGASGGHSRSPSLQRQHYLDDGIFDESGLRGRPGQNASVSAASSLRVPPGGASSRGNSAQGFSGQGPGWSQELPLRASMASPSGNPNLAARGAPPAVGGSWFPAVGGSCTAPATGAIAGQSPAHGGSCQVPPHRVANAQQPQARPQGPSMVAAPKAQAWQPAPGTHPGQVLRPMMQSHQFQHPGVQ